MARGISLRRYEESAAYIPNHGDAFRIVIEAYDASLMPEEIFGHQKRVIDPWTGEEGEDFCFVCSPEDLVVYPANEPDPVQSPPFYRKSKIDVIVASRDQALELWDAVQTRVCELVEALNRKDIVQVAEETRCGDPLDESASV